MVDAVKSRKPYPERTVKAAGAEEEEAEVEAEEAY